MAFPAIPILSLGRSLLMANTFVPWQTPLGSLMGSLPRRLPQGLVERLDEYLDQKAKAKANDRQVNQDFFSHNGILLAVPKKKVSHQKKRQKLYAPGSKQLKMIHHLNKCPSCGHQKRANTLCMHCVGEIRRIWSAQTAKPPQELPQEKILTELDKRILYAGKKDTEYREKLKEKDSYVERRMRPLPVATKK